MTQEVSSISCRFRDVLTEIRKKEAGDDYLRMAAEVTARGYKVSNKTVKNYEDSTTKKIPLEYIDMVCRTYNINHAYFFSADAPRRPTTPHRTERVLEIVRRAVDTTEEKDLDQILAALRKLPDGQ